MTKTKQICDRCQRELEHEAIEKLKNSSKEHLVEMCIGLMRLRK